MDNIFKYVTLSPFPSFCPSLFVGLSSGSATENKNKDFCSHITSHHFWPFSGSAMSKQSYAKLNFLGPTKYYYRVR